MSRFWPYLVLLGEADRPSRVKKYFFASVCVRVCGRASGPARPRAQNVRRSRTHTPSPYPSPFPSQSPSQSPYPFILLNKREQNEHMFILFNTCEYV